MDPRDEQKDLIANPLPPEVIVKKEGDENLPSRILECDHQIANLESALALARAARTELLKRAVALRIGKDDKAVIVVKESMSDRAIDPVLLKAQKPEIYDQLLALELTAEREKIQKKIDALSAENMSIRIGTAKTLMSEDDITTFSLPRTVSRSYQIIPVTVPLPKGKGIRLLEE